MEYIIYRLIRSDGKEYIGTTDSRNFKNRMSSHRNSNRFREHSFKIKILEKSFDIKLHEKEEIYIKKYDTFFNGLNETINGKGNHLSDKFTTRGYEYSKKSRTLMSISAKNRIKRDGIPFKGKNHSEKTKKHLSIIRKGKIHSSKLSKDDVLEIKQLYKIKPVLENVGKIQKNGKILSYKRAFSKNFSNTWNITEQNLYKIITGKSWKHVQVK